MDYTSTRNFLGNFGKKPIFGPKPRQENMQDENFVDENISLGSRKSRFGLWSDSSGKNDLVSSNNWTLSNDLICGTVKMQKVQCNEAATVEIAEQNLDVEMFNKVVQVCEADILLTNNNLCTTNHVIDRINSILDISSENAPENQAIRRPINAQRLLMRCDKSSQVNLAQDATSLDPPSVHSSALSEERKDFRANSDAKTVPDSGICVKSPNEALNVLKCYFPDVPLDDLEHVLENCDSDSQWAINVLLDSGHHLSSPPSSYPINASEAELGKPSSIDQWKAIGQLVSDQSDKTTDSSDGLQIEPGISPELLSKDGACIAEQILLDRPESQISGQSDEDLSVGCTVELSVDMANNLQQLFGRIFNDVPAELLNPQQLKMELPIDLAAQLFQCWLKTQTSQTYFDPSLTVQEEVYDFLNESFVDEDRAASSQAQTLTDVQYARQLVEHDTRVNADNLNEAASSLSTKIKLKILCDMFPLQDKLAMQAIFTATNYQLEPAIDLICDSLNVPLNRRKKLTDAQKNQEKSLHYPPLPSATVHAVLDEESGDLSSLSYERLRQMSLHHYEKRNKNFSQAQDAFHRNMRPVASYYAQQGRIHDAKLKEANYQAAQKLLNYRKRHDPPDTLDLHKLHVQEAICAMAEKLKEYENRPGKQLNVVTGSGRHSSNGPKIKPAIVAYLLRRKFRFSEINNGMIQITTK